MHDGTAHQIQARHAEVLDAAYTANPERYRRRPKPPAMPTKVWINQPPHHDRDRGATEQGNAA